MVEVDINSVLGAEALQLFVEATSGSPILRGQYDVRRTNGRLIDRRTPFAIETLKASDNLVVTKRAIDAENCIRILPADPSEDQKRITKIRVGGGFSLVEYHREPGTKPGIGHTNGFLRFGGRRRGLLAGDHRAEQQCQCGNGEEIAFHGSDARGLPKNVACCEFDEEWMSHKGTKSQRGFGDREDNKWSAATLAV